MKRDIACPECAPKYHNYPADNDGPAEYVKKVKGTAKQAYKCDACGMEIPRGGECVCISVWSDGRPYFSWESGYVVLRA
jgi:hypothetical protein